MLKRAKSSIRYVAQIPDLSTYLVWQEHPVVTALDLDLQEAGSHCTHCLKTIDPAEAIKQSQDPLSATYCSNICQKASSFNSHNLLFSLEPFLPIAIIPQVVTPQALEERRKAQALFWEHVKKEERPSVLLVARYVARQLVSETAKHAPVLDSGKKMTSENDFVGCDSEQFGLEDHFERLRYVDTKPPKDTHRLFTDLLSVPLPDVEHFVTDERLALLLSKISYNTFGVCFNRGRDNKVFIHLS
jgi:mitochondrial import receptor subunit TOM20